MNSITREELLACWPELVCVDCGEGWIPIIDACLRAAKDAGYDSSRESLSITFERNASLRVSIDCSHKSDVETLRAVRIQGAIDKANTSSVTCERCGESGRIKMSGGYLPPSCEDIDCPAGAKFSDRKNDKSGRQELPSVEGLSPESIRPPPPRGFDSWLDYAVDTFDTRSAEIERLFDDKSDDVIFSREDMRMAAKDELAELKNRAGSRNNSFAKLLAPETQPEHHMTYAELHARWPELPEIECHEGWCGVIDACMQSAKKAGYDSAKDQVRQVKEKFGTLRIYIHCSSSRKDGGERAKKIYEAITESNRSARTCEVCGALGKLMIADSFYMTRCDLHAPENARSIQAHFAERS